MPKKDQLIYALAVEMCVGGTMDDIAVPVEDVRNRILPALVVEDGHEEVTTVTGGVDPSVLLQKLVDGIPKGVRAAGIAHFLNDLI